MLEPDHYSPSPEAILPQRGLKELAITMLAGAVLVDITAIVPAMEIFGANALAEILLIANAVGAFGVGGLIYFQRRA